MATPRIRRGFILLDPERIPRWAYGRASTIKGSFKYGVLLKTLSSITSKVEHVDLIVEGSVAVSIYGDRIGKGHGYGDLEYGILAELGLVNPSTPVFTSVHDLQVFNNRLPKDPHDVSVNTIATPTRILTTIGSRRRPKGILWNLLDRRKLEEVPILRELAEARGHG